MPKPEEEKVSLAFETKNRIKALKAQAHRLDAMLEHGLGNKVSDRRKLFEPPVIAAVAQADYHLLQSQLQASEQSKKKLLSERKSLVNTHIISIKNNGNQLSALENVLPAFKNDPTYLDYTQKKQATTSQLEILENSLGKKQLMECVTIQQAIQEIGEGYAACYALLQQFLGRHAQALNINLQGAHIKNSDGAKIQTLVIQTEKGLQNVINEIKQIGVLEAALKEKDILLTAKDAEIAELKKKEAADKECASFALDIQKKAQAKAAVDQKKIKLQNALIKACEEGDIIQVKQLLQQGARSVEVSSTSKQPLGAAVWGMNPEVVRILLDEIGGKSSLTWKACKEHNLKHYKEVFMFSTFKPQTYEEWYDLLIKMNQSPYLCALNLAEAKKVWQNDDTSTWEKFVAYVGDGRLGWWSLEAAREVMWRGRRFCGVNGKLLAVFVGLHKAIETRISLASAAYTLIP